MPGSVTERGLLLSPTRMAAGLRQAKPIAPTTSHVWVDNGYTGQAAAAAVVTVDVVSGPKPGCGFIVHPRRWLVERTNGWINHPRRIDHHYEVTRAAKASSTSAITPYNSEDSTAASCSDTL